MSYSKEAKSWNPFPVEIWVSWIAATVVAVAGATAFVYMNFETKDAFTEYKQNQLQISEEIIKRLDRMEDKLDSLIKKN